MVACMAYMIDLEHFKSSPSVATLQLVACDRPDLDLAFPRTVVGTAGRDGPRALTPERSSLTVRILQSERQAILPRRA